MTTKVTEIKEMEMRDLWLKNKEESDRVSM